MSGSYWKRLAEDAKKVVENAQKAVSSAAVTEELEQAKIFFTSPNPERDLAARKARAASGEASGAAASGEEGSAGGADEDARLLDFDVSEHGQGQHGQERVVRSRAEASKKEPDFEGKSRDELAGLLRASLARVKAGERRAQELEEEREMHKQRADSLASMLSEAASPGALAPGVTEAEVEGLQASLKAVKEAAAAERETLTAEKEAVVAEKEALASEKEALVAEKETLAAENGTLSAEVSRLEAEVGEARVAGAAEDETIRSDKAKLDAAEQRVAFLEAQLAGETAKKVAAREKLESMRKEMGASKDHHKRQIEEQSKVLATLEKLKKEAGEHKAAADRAEGELEQSAAEREGLRGEVGRLEAVVADLEDKLAEARVVQGDVRLSSESRDSDVESSSGVEGAEVVADLRARISELEANADEGKKELEAKLSDMIGMLDQASAKTVGMKADRAKAVEEAQEAREECKKLAEELAEVSSKLKQSQAASSEIASERDRLTSSFDAKIELLEAKMAEQHEDEVLRVKKEYGEQLTQRNLEMATMTEELGREMMGLKGQYDEILEQKEGEVKQLSQRLKEVEDARAASLSGRSEAEIALQEEVDTAKQDLERVRTESAQASERAGAEAQALRRELEGLRAELAEAQALKGEVERLQAELAEAQALRGEVERLQTELAEAQKKQTEVQNLESEGSPEGAESGKEADWIQAVEALNAERVKSGSLTETLKEVQKQKEEAEKSREEIKEKFTKLQALAKEKLGKAEERAKAEAAKLTELQAELNGEKEKVEEATERLATQERKLKAAWAKVREAERNRDNEKLKGSGKVEEVKEAVKEAEEKAEAHKRTADESNERLRNALEQIGVLTESLGGLQVRLREADEDSAKAEERWGLERAQLGEEARRARQGELDSQERVARAESEAVEATERLRTERQDLGAQIRTLRSEVESLQAEAARSAEKLASATKLQAAEKDQVSGRQHSERLGAFEDKVHALEGELENARVQLAARDRREDKDRADLADRLEAAEARVQELQSQAAVLREEKEMANRRAAQAIRDAALVDRSSSGQGADQLVDPAETRARVSKDGSLGSAPLAPPPLRERSAGENGGDPRLDWSKKLARKEAELLRAANEVRTLQVALEESEATSELQVAQQEVLKGEIARMRGEVERAKLSAEGGVELEYVKNVVVKLLTLKGSHAPEGESDTLAAALCRVLRLSPSETQAVEEARRQRRASGSTPAAAVMESLGAQMATLGASILPNAARPGK